MFTTTKILSVLAGLSMATLTLATPTSITASKSIIASKTRTDLTATASMISYFVDTYCDSPNSQSASTITSNTCVDLGEGSTTRSLGLYDLAIQGGSGNASCVAKVWHHEICTGESVQLELGVEEPDDEICFIGTIQLGSVMLVCED